MQYDTVIINEFWNINMLHIQLIVVILIVIPYYSNYLYSTLNLPYIIGLIKSSSSYLQPMKRLGASFGSREPREPHPLPCLTS
jgi:hypothetical protein